MLHEIPIRNLYCGPSALLAITGKPYPEIRAAINAAKGRLRDNAGICGMNHREMRDTLAALGYPHDYIRCSTPEPLAKWIGGTAADTRYIVSVTGHFITLHNGTVYDNRTRFGCPVAEHWTKRKRVKAYFIIHN